MWKPLAATGLAVAGLTAVAYAGWLMSARRALFLAIAEGGEVTAQAARASDARDSAWLWATGLLVGAALLLWAAARVFGRVPLGSAGFVAASLVTVGLTVVLLGAGVGALAAGSAQEAGQAVWGCSLAGTGYLLVGLGHLTGAASLLRRPSDGYAPYLGYTGWSSG